MVAPEALPFGPAARGPPLHSVQSAGFPRGATGGVCVQWSALG